MPDELILGIPWKVIAASPDMMDVRYNNRRFPYAWRSSLAVSVFEPPVSDLPSTLCDQRIAFIKVTCSLTGYLSTGDEVDGTVSLEGNEPLEELGRLTTEYLGCYGALLNVAFFPTPSLLVGSEPTTDLAVYPHILDFSPKSRELIRGITESGELLTGSSQNIGIDKSRTTTNKSESEVGLEAGYKAGGFEATGKVSHKWGTTSEDKSALSIGGGTTQESNQSYTTNMDQLYSLLTGYHSGTNRATFIMLARPGTLQPTSRRTFALGLRMLEGVQDFIFVVSRPSNQNGLCIEVALNTGHYPEVIELTGEEIPMERRTFTFTVHARAVGGSWGGASGEVITFGTPDRPEDMFVLPSDGGAPWIIDVDQPGTEQGIARGPDRLHTEPVVSDGILHSGYDLRVIRVNDQTVQARGRVFARGGHDFTAAPTTVVDADFFIHAKRPQSASPERTAELDQMLVTTRGLNVCYISEDGCPRVIESDQLSPLENPDRENPDRENPDRTQWIPDLVHRQLDVNMTAEQRYSQIHSALIAASSASARGVTGRGFADTDYFSQKVANLIPNSIAKSPLSQVVNLKKYAKAGPILSNLNVQQFLSIRLRRIDRRFDLGVDGALDLRRDVLRQVERQLQNMYKD